MSRVLRLGLQCQLDNPLYIFIADTPGAAGTRGVTHTGNTFFQKPLAPQPDRPGANTKPDGDLTIWQTFRTKKHNLAAHRYTSFHCALAN
jgi:hypothetical protein